MADDLDAIRAMVRLNTLVETDDVSDAELLKYINLGYQEIASLYRWPWLETSASINVTASTQSYSLPADHLRSISIVDASEKRKLERISADLAFEEWGGDFDSADPANYYFVFGGSIYFVPTPATTESAAYTHYYIKQPTLLSAGTDTPEWTDEFHLVLADYASARVWEREEDLEKASAYTQRYLTGLGRMVEYYMNREDDQPLVYGNGIKPLRRGTNTPFHADGSLASW